MTPAIKYLDDDFPGFTTKRDNCRPYGQSQDGYGKKIATTLLVQLAGENRWRRVYCCIFSNIGSNYVIIAGINYYLK